jgi:hypothetical protein
MRTARGTALAFGVGLLFGGVTSTAVAQEPQVAPCRVQRGQRGVHEDNSIALGSMTIGSCARAIQAASGIGTWGLYEVEVDGNGHLRVNGEEVGVLRSLPNDGPKEGDDPGREQIGSGMPRSAASEV